MVKAELTQKISWTWECGKCGREFGYGATSKREAEECCSKNQRGEP